MTMSMVLARMNDKQKQELVLLALALGEVLDSGGHKTLDADKPSVLELHYQIVTQVRRLKKEFGLTEHLDQK